MNPITNLSDTFDANALGICQKLQEHGYDAVIVGGPVRDFLMGSRPNDIDIATSAIPNIVRRIFPRTYVQGSGEQHGTIGVVMNDTTYEVTTFRLDVMTDGRHAQVAFTESLEEDLLRRDFTINAIAVRPDRDTGKLVDPFEGAKDIERGIIRAVGEPELRFQEDYLRIMRGYRFAARFGFSIEPETREAMRAHMDGLKKISRERIREELLKMMEQTHGRGNLASALRMMQEDGVFARVLPELEQCVGVTQPGEHHAFDVFNHLVEACDAAKPSDPRMRFTMLLHDIGKPLTRTIRDGRAHFYDHESVGAEMADQICRRLAFSNEDREWVREAIQNHMRLVHINEGITGRALRKIANKLERVTLEELLEIRVADKLGSGVRQSEVAPDRIAEVKTKIEEMRASNAAVKISQLAISGHDVMKELGIKPGPHVGMILKSLLEVVVDDPAANTKERLLELAKEIHGALQKEDTRQPSSVRSHMRTV